MTTVFIINMTLGEPSKAIDFASVHSLVFELIGVAINTNWLL